MNGATKFCKIKETAKRPLNNFLTPSFFLFLTIPCLCQKKKPEEYPSRQETRFYESKHFPEFEPAEIPYIKGLKYDYLRLRSQNTDNSYVSYLEGTKHSKYYDSLDQICFERESKIIGTPEERHHDWPVAKYFRYYDSLESLGIVPKKKQRNIAAELACTKCLDSVKVLECREPVAGINYNLVLRQDSIANKKIVVYEDSNMIEFESGLWVGISVDHGKSWCRYFTGLVLNNFYFVKPNPKISLFKSDSIIQLEIAIIRRMQPYGRLNISERHYELVEDNLVMELGINKIALDSDNDGLTDLLERRVFTNPFSKDTDGDGICDAKDSNPRFRSIKTKYSSLFNYLLASGEMGSTFIPFDNLEQKKYQQSDTSTYFIVTDDIKLMPLLETKDRYIFLTPNERTDYRKLNQGSFAGVYVSPLFEVDNKHGVFKIWISWSYYGACYLVTEKKRGWDLKRIAAWIE